MQNDSEKVVAYFVVPGDPATQGSLTPRIRKGKPFATHGRKLRAWRTLAVPIARVASPREPFAGAVAVDLSVHVRRGKTVKRELPTSMRDGDIDKYARAVLDVLLMAGIVTDDSVVVGLSATKRYADHQFGSSGPRVVVVVRRA